METPKNADGRSARKDASRRKLLDTAFQMLSAEGVDALTTRHLAKVAQMSPKTVYNVFGSKAELLNAMIDDLPNRAPTHSVSEKNGDALDATLAMLDIITKEWVCQGSLIRSLLLAAKRNGDLASTMIPGVRRNLVKALEDFKANGWLEETVPISILASQIAYANAGLFDQFLAGFLSDEELWVSHRMNLLVPLRATAHSNFSKKIDARLRETLQRDSGQPK